MSGYTEKNLEEHIERSLHEVGYKSLLHTEYDRVNCIVQSDLIEFIKDTQKDVYDKLVEQYGPETDTKLILRLTNEISGRGVIDCLRKGIKDRGCHFSLVYFEPKSGLNPEHQELYQKNRFTAIRQLHYSSKNNNSLDMALFINGIFIVTMELKNQLTGQTIIDSEKQYRYDRDPNEPLFQFKRVIVHFCCDNDKVSMTTRLMGGKTKFLPYNKGIINPINLTGLKTSYLWKEILTKESMLDILENFVHVSIETDKDFDPKLGKVIEKKKELLVFPRYHQLDVIRKLRTSVRTEGVGNNYLIQHTTGSGKSYSIGWLSHLLTSIYRTKDDNNRMFDSIIVITDRKVLDRQLQNTIKQLEQTTGVVNPVDENSSQLKKHLESGKDIIITTIQKFPRISETISQLQSKTFGIIIDEVHSSQSGEGAKHLKQSLSKGVEYDYEENEEISDIDDFIREEIRSRGKQKHISFFGFSGTPKNKTLELFGRKDDEGHFIPFHTYTMKQSITEGFTLDVLETYTTYQQWFKLNKRVEEDKELPKMKVMKRLINFVDDQSHTITQKVKIILDHFINHTSKKLGGKGRGMIVVRSRLHCVRYKMEMDKQMKELGLPYSSLVAFSGSVFDFDTSNEYTENSMNKLSQGVSIPDSFKDPKYRLLIVSNKFQTGYDEPLLHSMYVDKTLRGLQCVQTLSRLNRTTTGKTDTFVLDFVNTSDEIFESFQPYYQKTILTGETDPNRLYTIETDIKKFNLFTEYEIQEFCDVFYDKNQAQELLQPILNRVVHNWSRIEDENERENFRSLIQSYLRLYGYISQIVTFEDIDLEKLYVFLRYLNKKLPRREKENIEDITSLVDLDSFRLEETFKGKIALEEKDGEFEPLGSGVSKVFVEDELDSLTQIILRINEIYGDQITDEDKLDLENMKKRVMTNEELQKVMTGDNSETNKRHKFEEVMTTILLSYVNNRLDFYNKMDDPKIKNFIGDILYSELKNQNQINP
ncbi:MAG: type I restriction endonuclease subunit R [Bacteroidetes bacterium]|nr:type I restriction endonuclease subunit R [Bacteroidota bacterium]